MNPEVDWFFTKATKWQEAYAELRELVLATGLSENLKWGCPCYSIGKNNIVLIHGFKDYCALLFMKGALMKDTQGVLIQQTANVQSARQLRFENVAQILSCKVMISAYLEEAIDIDKAGLKVEMKKTTEYSIPAEFQRALTESPELQQAFSSLAPGRQRGYLLYFAAARQVKTREARIEKYWQYIIDGKGLND